ncbi:MAG: hypothetical protein F6K50_35335 [Moorea sp. SIO3I7]|uniref:hypothetical protein n=1 Tax=Moorena TaxID=1155738 RepID=UPI0013BF2602|nr:MULTISPECIES: hypothetical protein [unclassified Moorena]NEO00530.1 hypothetical protein [Moorena sp. SIO3I7]NEO47222.1 hypothetical protein [Moorena sp. SIO4A3]NEO04652.1 hypothetical protein [Moorena sp. SIO3I8]NEO19795.1 hypothetical protein [Moorena sp. SIO4A5]NEQ56613.1 hypothetical protein [Moorena sp. SIO4A1]
MTTNYLTNYFFSFLVIKVEVTVNTYFCFPIPYSLFPIPYSLFPIPYSLLPIPYSLYSLPASSI